MRRLRLLDKVLSSGKPTYIFDFLPSMKNSHRHKNSSSAVIVINE